MHSPKLHFLQENLDNMLESANLLKRAICTVTLPMLNESSLDVFTNAVFTFCKTNNTVFEVSLYTVNQVYFCVCA